MGKSEEIPPRRPILAHIDAVLLLILVCDPDEIVRAHSVKAAQLDEVVDLQLGSAVLDVAIPLLGFVDNRGNLPLGQVAVLAQVSHSRPIIHYTPSQCFCCHRATADLHADRGLM